MPRYIKGIVIRKCSLDVDKEIILEQINAEEKRACFTPTKLLGAHENYQLEPNSLASILRENGEKVRKGVSRGEVYSMWDKCKLQLEQRECPPEA